MKGFTLIELLIVVAIIAILAAIAVPNFLEAQVRSKVSRVKADFRSLSTALESYCIDDGHYPPALALSWQEGTGTAMMDRSLFRLTTPVAYITSVSMRDPFGGTVNIPSTTFLRPGYQFLNYEALIPGDFANLCRSSSWCNGQSHRAYGLSSPGPDRTESYLYFVEANSTEQMTYFGTIGPPFNFGIFVYDPTNGTVSYGDMLRLGGDVQYTRGSTGG